MELGQVKRKIEGEADRTPQDGRSAWYLRGGSGDPHEYAPVFPSHPFSLCLSLSLPLSLTDTLPEAEIEQERRSRTEAQLICKRLDAKTTSTSSSMLRSSLARQLRMPRRPLTKLAETLDNEVKQRE